MYAEYFELNEQPFNDGYDPRVYCSTPDHEEVLASLIYTVGELKGILLLTGDAGTGKTLLARQMLAHFDRRIAFAELTGGVLDRDELLPAICTEFGLAVGPEDGTLALMGALDEYLIEQFAAQRPCVLILDDAHLIPPAALASLCALNNIESHDVKLLQIVLIGQPELCTALGEARLRPLRQRCFRTCRLPALNRGQTEAYIAHRLKVAGAEHQKIFDAAAIDAIYEHSRGVPRLINTVCDNVMLSAFASETKLILPGFINIVAEQTMMLNDAPAASEAHRRPPPPVPDPPDGVTAADASPTPEGVGMSADASPTPAATGMSAEEVALAQRVEAVEGKISGLISFKPTFQIGVDELERVIGRHLASWERRVSGLFGGVPPAAPRSRSHESVDERLTSMERKITLLGDRGVGTGQPSAASVRETGERIAAEVARSRQAVRPPTQRVATPSRDAPEPSAPAQGVTSPGGVIEEPRARSGRTDGGDAHIAPARSAEREIAPFVDPDERMSSGAGGRAVAQPGRYGDSGRPHGLADASPAQRLLKSVRRLSRLVEGAANDSGRP